VAGTHRSLSGIARAITGATNGPFDQNLVEGSNSLLALENFLFGENNSLLRQKISLFHCVGNLGASHWVCSSIRSKNRGKGPKIEKFPVIFPVSREFGC